ncbi:serine/threonine-protein phosphatase 4 regulatory subunit 3A [Galendromus occidentalis]|uniref:Serine/threonine-protein phosphatase 4 regulatory subunit 3A n=1 Tax=Galendromus occidentalis TaxID=34638 RepID=A0AAJ7L541_9ACAR|nr:serine/threonine-protein phosphatase 4 regulatory subunit 3A [Galendromus occidentalis]
MSDGADQETGAAITPSVTQDANTSSEETNSGSTSPQSSPPHAQNGAAAATLTATTSASTSASGSGASSTAQQASTSITNTANQEQSVRRRVKLYLLNAERQWDDKGTGYVSSPYVDALGGISLVVRAEIDASLLLESKVQPETAYQRQQGTLIVWSEGDNYDLALSFQERAGCDEIWKTICQIQGRDPSVDITQEVVESEDEGHEGQVALHTTSRTMLPTCEISHLPDISKILQECLPFPMRRDSVASAIESEDYITKLLDLFTVVEDLEDLDSLHTLYNIFKSIFLLNKNALLDMMFTEENIMQVVGVLEYEPNKPRIRHREYLNATAKFHQVIPFSDPELTSKIHQTYRVQYIQEVVLPTPSIFEENMLASLSSFIFFNKSDIVTILQDDRNFLDQLFTQLKQDTSIEQKRNLVLFLKEFCNFSQTLQPQSREPFFKTLFTLGILQVIECTLQSEDSIIKSASIDILSYLVDFSTAMVRQYCLEQYQSCSERLLMEIILKQILADPEPDVGVSVQLSGILRMLLDPETFVPTENKNSFLTGFYKYSMHVLTDRILEHQKTPPTPPKASLLAHIIEFLSFCVEHHTYHIKNYILHKDLLKKVLEFMKYRNPHLALCALRFVRRIIGLKDDFYNRHITVNCLLRPVVDALKRNSGRYNLLDSAIIELFEFIRSEDISLLGIHVVEQYAAELEDISYVKTFRELRSKFNEQGDRTRMKMPSVNDVGGMMSAAELRYKRDPRQLDEDEEKWFEAEDDTLTTTTTNISDLEERLALDDGAPRQDGLTAVKLVDYPDEDSDDEQPQQSTSTQHNNGGQFRAEDEADDEDEDPPSKRLRQDAEDDEEKAKPEELTPTRRRRRASRDDENEEENDRRKRIRHHRDPQADDVEEDSDEDEVEDESDDDEEDDDSDANSGSKDGSVRAASEISSSEEDSRTTTTTDSEDGERNVNVDDQEHSNILNRTQQQPQQTPQDQLHLPTPDQEQRESRKDQQDPRQEQTSLLEDNQERKASSTGAQREEGDKLLQEKDISSQDTQPKQDQEHRAQLEVERSPPPSQLEQLQQQQKQLTEQQQIQQ